MQVCDKNTPAFAKLYLSWSLDSNEKHLFGLSCKHALMQIHSQESSVSMLTLHEATKTYLHMVAENLPHLQRQIWCQIIYDRS